MTPATAFKTKPEVVHTELDAGSAVLLDLDTHRYFSLNESGAMIWTLLASGENTAEIAQRLAERFSLDAEKAGNDVQSLTDQLCHAGLIAEAS